MTIPPKLKVAICWIAVFILLATAAFALNWFPLVLLAVLCGLIAYLIHCENLPAEPEHLEQ